MIMEGIEEAEELSNMLQRTTLCVSGPEPGITSHNGDDGFREAVNEHYTVAENNAVEKLVRLKAQLRQASLYDFWKILMEGMTAIAGAQYGFVAKQMEVDDQDPKINLPDFGEPGSCLMGVAFYYNDGKNIENFHRNFKYFAYGSPCEHMKNEKVFLIPNGYPRFIPDNPNPFPFPVEAYLGVPLFAQGTSYGHFGLMWSAPGLRSLRLSWAFLELFMHSLEDLIDERLLETPTYTKHARRTRSPKVVPREAAPASQSLKPYARSLSHELRTPMQGVVGMLDMMYATVQESLETQNDAMIRTILNTLRDNIEVIQG